MICEGSMSGLTQAFPCCLANQGATIRLEKLSTMYEYPHQIESDWGGHF